jgi:hypothetical protein
MTFKPRKIVLPLVFLAAFGVILTFLFWENGPTGLINQPSNVLERAKYNYGDEVKEYSDRLNLPYEYFMALIVLECSGNQPSGSRFEPHVFAKLKDVRDGNRRKYENVKPEILANASDDAIKNLATSWGPLQLMGYKCIGMKVNVEDIRGEDAVFHGMSWVDDEYGQLLRKGKYKDAFHTHNTGRKYPLVGGPKTHDPKYVEKGLQYIKYFSKE